MQVIAVLSLKGGVGKTTVVLGLAGAAVSRGLRTLVVDLDPQANATTALEPGPTTATIADVLDEPRRAMVNRAIAPSAWGDDLDVLVGSETNERHNHPSPSRAQLGRLNRALERLLPPPTASDGTEAIPVADGGSGPDGEPDTVSGTAGGPVGRDPASPEPVGGGAHGEPGGESSGAGPDGLADDGEDDPYRLVLIDCPPSLGQLTRSALVAANRAVLVTDPTIFAVAGVQRAFEAVQNERVTHNPDLQPLGVLINRVRSRSAEHDYRVSELRELFGPLVLTGVIPDRSAIQQAQGACVPIQMWDTPGAREVSAVFDGLLGRILRGRDRPAAAWTQQRAHLFTGRPRASG